MKVFIKKNLCSEKSCTRALRQQYGYMDVFSYEDFLYQIWFSRNEDSIISGGLLPRGIGLSNDRKCSVPLTRVATWIRIPIWLTSRTSIGRSITICVSLVWKRHTTRLTSNKQRMVVSCVATQFWPSSSPWSSTSKMEQKGRWKHSQKKGREASGNKNQCTRETAGIISSITEFFFFGRKKNWRSLRSQLVHQKLQNMHNILQVR